MWEAGNINSPTTQQKIKYQISNTKSRLIWWRLCRHYTFTKTNIGLTSSLYPQSTATAFWCHVMWDSEWMCFTAADIFASSPRHCHHSSLPWHHKNDAKRASLAAAAEEDWRERRRSNLQSHRFLRQSRWNGSGGMFRLSFSLCPSPHLRLARTERLLRNCPDLRLSLSWLLVELALVFHAELFEGSPNVFFLTARSNPLLQSCNPKECTMHAFWRQLQDQHLKPSPLHLRHTGCSSAVY